MDLMELFNHLDVWKQVTDVELLVLDKNTWTYLQKND